MTLGKGISLYLIDADPTGRIAAELFNWTGKVYKLPRRLLRETSTRNDLQRAGVYFLFGRDEAEGDRLQVYVGEAEEVYRRLMQHQDKDFWNEAVVCISKDENLNKAHIKFLEHELHRTLLEVGRASVRNGNVPPQPLISELEQAVMTEFLANLKLLVSTLGYRVLEPIVKAEARVGAPSFYMIKAARGADARAAVTNEGIVVLKGSRAAASTVPSVPVWVQNARNHLVESKIIEIHNNEWRFVKDHVFSSPSAAAAVVLGRAANGLTEWKTSGGMTLKASEELG